MAKGKGRAEKASIRILDTALLDEAGNRWEYDARVGMTSDIAGLVKDERPDRIMEGHYADTRDLTDHDDAFASMIRFDSEQSTAQKQAWWYAGVYRREGRCIVYLMRH